MIRVLLFLAFNSPALKNARTQPLDYMVTIDGRVIEGKIKRASRGDVVYLLGEHRDKTGVHPQLVRSYVLAEKGEKPARVFDAVSVSESMQLHRKQSQKKVPSIRRTNLRRQMESLPQRSTAHQPSAYGHPYLYFSW